MAYTFEEFGEGRDYWINQTRWTPDFHNSLYQKLPGMFDGNFDETWWSAVWPVLWRWKATRRGGGHRRMSERAREQFGNLNQTWAKSRALVVNGTIEAVPWEEVAAFTEVVSRIKAVRSPVFTSKLCHFLSPRVFPVVDNRAMGNPFGTYAAHYCAVRSEWTETSHTDKQRLRSALAAAIGVPMIQGYPEEVKIAELCLIGRNQAKKRARNP